MSIWSSFGGVEPLYRVEYGWDPADIEPGSYLNLADSGWYGGNALRVSLEHGEEGHVCARGQP